MGLTHSRWIYDPENRNLNLQYLAEMHHTHIGAWKIDNEGRMICNESIDVLPIIDNKFKELYAHLHKLGLKGIDHRGEVYSFSEKW